jgi:DNA-binding GntR family transcriptional regulator
VVCTATDRKVFQDLIEQANHAPSRLQRNLLPEIMSMIRSNDLAPGARLVELSEADLMRRYGASGGLLKRTLTQLEQLGGG